MCNAFNHSPNCSCGWGGVWYGSAGDGATWLFNRPLHHPRKLGRQSGTWQTISRGHTGPNSSCPVCGQRVYFYASPHGGRVFFDELGPPWPKHPCTDNSVGPKHAPDRRQDQRAGAPLSWLGDVHLAKVGPVTYEMQGQSDGKKYRFHFDADEIVMAEMVRFRLLQRGNIELHILDYNDERRCWIAWQGIARVKRDAVGVGGWLSSSVVHQHDQKTLRAALPYGGQNSRLVPGHPEGVIAPLQKRVAPMQGAVQVTKNGLYQCPKCRTAVKRGKLLRHLVEVHSVRMADLPSLPAIAPAELAQLVQCPQCPAMVSLKNMRKHRRQQHPGIVPQDQTGGPAPLKN